MNVAMMWFQNDPKKSLSEKIAEAMNYHQKKYGSRPDLCFVHPSMLSVSVKEKYPIEVRSTRYILPNHIWIGCGNGNVGVSSV